MKLWQRIVLFLFLANILTNAVSLAFMFLWKRFGAGDDFVSQIILYYVAIPCAFYTFSYIVALVEFPPADANSRTAGWCLGAYVVVQVLAWKALFPGLPLEKAANTIVVMTIALGLALWQAFWFLKKYGVGKKTAMTGVELSEAWKRYAEDQKAKSKSPSIAS